MAMEPLRGGSLAGHVPADVQKIYDESVVNGRRPNGPCAGSGTTRK